MEIRNVTQFANFMSSNELANLDSIFQQIIQCVNSYASACNCYKVEDKLKLYNNCTRMYSDAVKIVVPKLKNVILAKVPLGKISFYTDNGTLITTVSR